MMNKKDLKMYEAPACEVVELMVNAQLLAGSSVPGSFNDDADGESSVDGD